MILCGIGGFVIVIPYERLKTTPRWFANNTFGDDFLVKIRQRGTLLRWTKLFLLGLFPLASPTAVYIFLNMYLNLWAIHLTTKISVSVVHLAHIFTLMVFLGCVLFSVITLASEPIWKFCRVFLSVIMTLYCVSISVFYVPNLISTHAWSENVTSNLVFEYLNQIPVLLQALRISWLWFAGIVTILFLLFLFLCFFY